MIQFNLLPEVKLEYIKARRTKRLVILVSTIVAGASITITVVLFMATNVLQRKHLNDLSGDIKHDSSQLEGEKDLNKILTVQNQLDSLDSLHAQKPAAARLGTYLSQMVPQDVTMTKITADFTAHTASFDGSAKSLSAVNKFIDTLKFTTYKVGNQKGNAFSAVVLATFDRSDEQAGNNGKVATYQITLNFEPVIFDIEKNVELVVPNTVTTRSTLESPASPFQSSQGEGQ